MFVRYDFVTKKECIKGEIGVGIKKVSLPKRMIRLVLI